MCRKSVLCGTYRKDVSQVSTSMIGVVTFIYLVTAVTLWLEGQRGMSLCFAGYALANVGLIWALTSTLRP